MRTQGRPATRTTPLFVTKRVPIIRFGDFCQFYGPDIMRLLAQFDDEPEENIRFSKDFDGWIKRLQKNQIPVYCKNRYHQTILNRLYRQYRKQGLGPNYKTIEATCFPKNVYYGSYECWYIHANKTDLIPDFCESCRERLDEHLNRNFKLARIPFDFCTQKITENMGAALENYNLFENLPEKLAKSEEPEKTEKILHPMKIEEDYSEEKPVQEERMGQKKQVEQNPTLFSTQTLPHINPQATRKRKSIRKRKSFKGKFGKLEAIPEVKNEEDSMNL